MREKRGFRDKHKGIILCLTTAFFSAGLYVYVPNLSPYAEKLGAGYTMIGMIGGAYGLTQMVVRIPLGLFSDHRGRRKIFITVGLVLTIVSGIVTWLRPTPISLLSIRLCAGLSAATWLAYTVLYSSYYKDESTTGVIGTITAAFTLGQIGAMLMGGILPNFVPQRFLFLFTAATGVAGFLLSLLVYEDSSDFGDKIHLKGLLKTVLNLRLLKVSVLAILTQIITFGGVFGFVPIVASNLKAGDLILGFLSILGMIPGVFIPVIYRKFLHRKLNPAALVIAGFSINAAFCTAVPFITDIPLLLTVQFLGGFGRGLIFPLLMGLSIHGIDGNRRGTAMGVFQSLYGIGMFIGPVLFGIIGESFSLQISFFTGALLSVAGIILTVLFRISDQTEL